VRIIPTISVKLIRERFFRRERKRDKKWYDLKVGKDEAIR